MEQKKNEITTIDEYIAEFSPEIQEILTNIRTLIRECAPTAKEKISYRMPAFTLNGNLLYFAAFQRHIGFYPTSEAIDAFKNELAEYKTSKGAIQFPLSKPIPYNLIREIVQFRVAGAI